MKIRLSLLLCALLLSLLVGSWAQAAISWVATADAGAVDVFRSTQPVNDGYVASGYTTQSNNQTVGIVVKVSANGDVLWKRKYHFGSIDKIQVLPGGMLTAGYSTFGSVVMMLDNSGNVSWSCYIQTDDVPVYVSDMKLLADGGAVLAGKRGNRAWVARLDSDGGVLWQSSYSADAANGIALSSDGGYVVTGYVAGVGSGKNDVWVLKIDSAGKQIWSKILGGADDDEGVAIVQDLAGNYIVAANTRSFGSGKRDIWLMKFDCNGNIIWQYTYGSVGADIVSSIRLTADGGFLLAGTVVSGTKTFGWLLKMDGGGGVTWQKGFAATGNVDAVDAFQSMDRGFVVAGYIANQSIDGLLIKLDRSAELPGCSSVNVSVPVYERKVTYVQPSDYAVNAFIETVKQANAYASYAEAVSLNMQAVCGNVADTQKWKKVFLPVDTNRHIGEATAVGNTVDGGYILAGNDWYPGSHGTAWAMKLDPAGGTVWQTAINGSYDFDIYSIQQTSDGGFIAAGAYSFDGWLTKLDSNGNVLWQKAYGWNYNEMFKSVQQTADGGYIVSGYTESNGSGWNDAWILKLDFNGNVQWSHIRGGKDSDGADYNISSNIRQTSDGGYIWSGFSYSNKYNVWIMKFDQNGMLAWEKYLGGNDGVLAEYIQQTPDGGFIVLGSQFSSDKADEALLIKLDSDGNLEWQQLYGTNGNDRSRALVQSGDGGYVLAGYTYANSVNNAWLFKVDGGGRLLWQKMYGNVSKESEILALTQTADGGYLLAGSVGTGSERNILALKVDANGNLAGCSNVENTNASARTANLSFMNVSAMTYYIAPDVSVPAMGVANSLFNPSVQCSANYSLYNLYLSSTGNGSGSVVATPAGDYCGADCMSYSGGTSVALTGVPAANSVFSGWDGCNSMISRCDLQITEDHYVKATFVKQVTVKAGNDFYSSLSEGYGKINNNEKILAKNVDFSENLMLNRNVAFTLSGGYGPAFNTVVGYTALDGVLTVMSGSVVVDRLVVK